MLKDHLMPKETERKFLVRNDSFKAFSSPVHIRQGFLSSDKERVVRIRLAGEEAFLTVKGISRGATRAEFEYPIPADEARYMLENLCEKPVIDKHRYVIREGAAKWEVDVFHGENEGLVIAEIELEDEDQEFSKPDWIGEEVTEDPRYFNANLIRHPFSQWDA